MVDTNDPYYRKWYVDIKRGVYQLRSLINEEMRESIENKLIEDYKNGKLKEKGIDQLIQWKLLQIHNKVITVDDINPDIKDLIQKAIDDGVALRL